MFYFNDGSDLTVKIDYFSNFYIFFNINRCQMFYPIDMVQPKKLVGVRNKWKQNEGERSLFLSIEYIYYLNLFQMEMHWYIYMFVCNTCYWHNYYCSCSHALISIVNKTIFVIHCQTYLIFFSLPYTNQYPCAFVFVSVEKWHQQFLLIFPVFIFEYDRFLI